jgi:hypothetical protein
MVGSTVWSTNQVYFDQRLTGTNPMNKRDISIVLVFRVAPVSIIARKGCDFCILLRVRAIL